MSETSLELEAGTELAQLAEVVESTLRVGAATEGSAVVWYGAGVAGVQARGAGGAGRGESTTSLRQSSTHLAERDRGR
jgi:hypothetical protein